MKTIINCALDNKSKAIMLIVVKLVQKGHEFKESITFDDIQKCSCVGVCLVVVCETDDMIIVFRSFSPQTIR